MKSTLNYDKYLRISWFGKPRRHVVIVTKYFCPGHWTRARHALAVLGLAIPWKQLFMRNPEIFVRESATISATSEDNAVVNNHIPSPAGSQLYFEAYFSSFKMSSHETLICINFHFDEAIPHLCQFEETFANHRHVQVTFSLTHATQHPAKSFLPMFLPVLCLLHITVPKPNKLDTNFTEPLSEWNPNRVAWTESQFRLVPIFSLFHLEIKFRF